MSEPEPVTGALPAYQWDSEASVAYEAAVEAIGAVIGAYSELIAAQEERPPQERDEAAITRWETAQAACHADRRALDAGDSTAIRRVRETYAHRLQELNRAAR